MTQTAALVLGVSLCAVALLTTVKPAVGQVITSNTPSAPQPTNSQEAPRPEVDHVERGVGLPQGVGPVNVRAVRPGALQFASYDENQDGRITQEKIETGSAASFRVADKNKDGLLTGFELQDWAKLAGDTDGSLSNPMQFDTNLEPRR